jgi:hypothetical protein
MSVVELQIALRSSAWAPESSDKVLACILDESQAWSRHVSCCIFPECGSGFHEWQIVSSLLEEGQQIKNVIFMDAYIEKEWTVHWNALAKLHSIQLTILNSYDTLEKLEKVGQSIVLYVNGCLRFGCDFPPESKEAAIAFWNWCQEGALNKPVNFVRGERLLPGGCSDWKALALLHQNS